MGAISVQLDSPAFAALSRERQLRVACNEFIGTVMFGEMLREARESTLNGDLLSSSAQKVFQSQLDDVLIQQAMSGSHEQSTFGALGEALYRSVSGRPQAPPPTLSVEG